MGKQWKQWQILSSWAPKLLPMVIAAMKWKDACSLEEKLWQTWREVKRSESRSVISDFLRLHGLHSPWDSPGQNTGVGSLSLFQGIFPTQGLNPGLGHCRWILYQLSQKGSPRVVEWKAYCFSSRSSRPRNRKGVFCIPGGLFTNWAMREALTNLDRILKSRDISLPTKVHLVKAMLFPGVMNGYESWTIKKAERWRINAFEPWCWRRLLRVPWTARRSN